MPAPDADLLAALRAAQRGDEDGFRVLYRAVQPGILRYLRVLVSQDAEDVASETWLQIAQNIDSFTGGVDDFRGWAATIARNRAMDLLRKQQRRPGATEPIELLNEMPAPDDTELAAATSISTEAALALIASLPKDQAEAVLLRVVLGLDAKTAAEVLDKRAGAVRTAAYRGLNRLNQRLSDARGVTDPVRPTL